MSARSTILVIIMTLGLAIAAPAHAQQPDSFATLPANHWSYQALEVLSQAGLTKALPEVQAGLNRYEIALLVGELNASIESELRRDGVRKKDQVTADAVSRVMQEMSQQSAGFMTDSALLAFSDLRSEFSGELSLLKLQGTLLEEFAPVVVNGITSAGRAPGGVVTGSTDTERWETETEFRPKYNLMFNTDVSEGIWAQAEVSGDFSDILSPDRDILPRTTVKGSTPIELERVDLIIDKETLNARVSNRLYTTLDRYTLYDQELIGAEAEVLLGNLGTTVVFGQSADSTTVTALNGQYRLNPNFQVGGTIVSADRGEELQSTNYGVNSFLRVIPGLELGGQYYINGEDEGGTALELTAWSQLAGVNLQADFTQIDADYWSPLAIGSADTYIPGSKGYRLSADTAVGEVGLAAEYGVHDYELAAEQAVTRGVSATVPLIPDRVDLEANYQLVDVDALYSPDYSTSTINIGSNLKLTDQITLKAGFEVSRDSDENSYQSVNADVNVGLSEKAQLNADVLVGAETGLRQSNHKEAGIELGYRFNEYTELTANYRLINFDSDEDAQDLKANQASAELKLNF